MTVFGSFGFWVTFILLTAVLLTVFVLHERSKRNRPTQRRGAKPGDPDAQFITDWQLNAGVRVNYVPSDPKIQAEAFVPADRKD